MNLKRNILFLCSLILLLTSCGLDELPEYDLKYIHIMMNESSETTVSSKANTVGTYNIYLSAPASEETVTVTYEIIVGDGLKEGVDYKIITQGSTLTFLPGIYDMPIRIQWFPNIIDPNKDNTIKIKLLSNDKGYSIGLPGPNQNQSVFTIRKI